MYKKFGYSIYRQVIDYYSGANQEDAYGACARRFSSHRGANSFEALRRQMPTFVHEWLRLLMVDMRLALPRDVDKKSIIPLDPLRVNPGEND